MCLACEWLPRFILLSVLYISMYACKALFCFQALQPPVANAAAVSLACAGSAADTSRSVIDLTDDDDTNAAPAITAILPTQDARVFYVAHQPVAGVPALVPSSTSTAVVKPMRPVPPPLLQIAPSQQPRLQVPA